MSIDGIIINRVLPKSVNDSYFQDWQESQKEYIIKAEEYFHPIPIFKVNLFKGEILGYKHLKELAEQVYMEKNPLELFFEGEPYSLIKENGRYKMSIRLPFIEKEDVELNKVSDELILRIGSFKKENGRGKGSGSPSRRGIQGNVLDRTALEFI